jgi:type II secretion system protein H
MTLSLKPPRSGFTLLELLIVLVLVGIAGTMAVPPINRMLAASRIDQTASVISTEMQKARSLASRVRRPMIFSTSVDSRLLQVTEVGGELQSEVRFDVDSDMRLQSMATTDSMVVMFPNGLSDGPVTITIGDGGNQRQIVMNRAGQIRVATP